ncbi:MAG: type II toxin-antitoxin system VapC family toxin [Pseudonocardia sp.]|nr:type II toxin-antitoxin system VapC family toxin [Pseudonocardia sp.]
MIVYVETSAAAKLVVEEEASERLAGWLDTTVREGALLVSSTLLETELRRLAIGLQLDQSDVTALPSRFDLVEPDRTVYREAGLLPGPHLPSPHMPSPHMRSLDALHLAVALRSDADTMVTYDVRQSEAAANSGLPVLAP